MSWHERNRRGMSLRETATATGIPFNTLARVEKGHVPDLPKFKRLVEWCGALDIKQFFEMQEKAEATPDLISEHLRTDRNLPPGAADQIAGIVGGALSGAGTSPKKSLQYICGPRKHSVQTRLVPWGFCWMTLA